MAKQAIKEYVIKITAEAQQAQQVIDKLAESFSQVGISNKFDLDLKKQTEAITGSIGKVIDEMTEMKKVFREGLNTKEFSDDIKKLNAAVELMKTSFEGFSKTYEGFIGGGGGLGKTLEAFEKQMGDFLNAFSNIFEIAEKKADKKHDITNLLPDVDDIKDSVIKQKQTISEAQKQIKQEKKQLQELKEAQDEINEIVERFKKNRKKIDIAAGTGVKEGKQGSAWMQQKELEEAEDIIKKTIQIANKYSRKKIEGINIQEMLFDQIKTTPTGLNRSLDNIVQNIDNAMERAKQKIVDNAQTSSSGEKTKIQLQLEVNPDAVSEQSISSIVEQIKSQVISKINKRLKDTPISVPIGLTPTVENKNNVETALIESGVVDENKSKFNGISRSLYVDVKLNTDGVVKKIDDEILKINKQITQTIDVKIRPIVPSTFEIDDTIGQTQENLENAVKKYNDADGISIDFSKVLSRLPSNTFDKQSYNELTGIHGVVKQILDILSNWNLPHYQRISPNIPPTLPPSPQKNNSPTSTSSGAVTYTTTPNVPHVPPQKKKQENVVVQNVNTQNVSNVVPPKNGKHLIQQPQAQPQTQAQSQAQTQKTPKILNGPKINLENWMNYLMRGRQINSTRKNETDQNWITSSQRYSVSLFKEGIKAFLSDLKNPDRTIDDIKGKNYYSMSYPSQGKQLAFYGKQGQEISDFQSKLTSIFDDTHKEVVSIVDDLRSAFNADKTDTELVDSNVGLYLNKNVLSVMKKKATDEYRTGLTERRDYINNLLSDNYAYIPRSGSDSTKQEIDRVQQDIKDFSEEMETTIANIHGNFVPKWMMRIIDDDYYQEELDLKGKRFANRKKALEDTNPNWGTDLRKDLQGSIQRRISELEKSIQDIERNFAPLEQRRNEISEQIHTARENLNNSQNNLNDLIDTVRQYYIRDKVKLPSKKKAELKDKIKEQRDDVRSKRKIYNDTYSQLSGSLKEVNKQLSEQSSIYKQELKNLNDQLATERTKLEKIQSMSDDELLKENIKREHERKRLDYSRYTGGITEEYDEKLGKILAREIGKKTDKVAREAIKAQFGNDTFNRQRDYNMTLLDANDFGGGQKRVRDLERNGLVVDPKSGNIISFKTPEVSSKWAYDDLLERMETVRLIAQQQIDRQFEITQILSEGEENLTKYVEAYDRHRSDTATDEDDKTIQELKDVVASKAYYFAKQEEIDAAIAQNEKLQKKVGSNKATKAERELLMQNEQLIGGYKNLNEFQVYEFAKIWEDKIQASRDQENYITGHYMKILSDMADKDSSRILTKKGYEKILKELNENDKTIIKYRNRVGNKEIPRRRDQSGRIRGTQTGASTADLTDYEADQYWRAIDKRHELSRKILGYQYGNGIKDLKTSITGKELSVDKMRVTNLGLADDTSRLYAGLPNINDISSVYRDKSGKIQYDQFGNALRVASGKTQEELSGYAKILSDAISQMEKTISSLPSDENKLRQIAAKEVDVQIKELQDQLNLTKQEIASRNAYNEERDKKIAAGEVVTSGRKSTKRLEHDQELLESSILQLTSDIGNKSVELVKTNRAQVAELQKEEQKLIREVQKKTGITDDVVNKITTLKEARKDRQNIYNEYRDVGDLVGKDYKFNGETVYATGRNVNKRKPQDIVIENVNKIVKSIFGEDTLKTFDYKAITGYDYNSVEELVEHFDNLESLLKMYDDIVEEAEKELQKVLPKNKANQILQETGIKTSDIYGEEVFATGSGEILEKLMQNREKQQELLGEIRETEYEMQRLGVSGKSFRETRIDTRVSQMKQQRDSIISIMELAKKDRDAYLQMADLARERAATLEASRKENAANIQLVESLTKSVEANPQIRIDELQKQKLDAQANIQGELDKQNALLTQQREAIVNEFNESQEDLNKKTAALSVAQNDLAQSKVIVSLKKEDIYGQNQEYASMSKRISDLRGSKIGATKEDIIQINTQLSEAQRQLRYIISDINKQTLNLLQNSVLDLQSAVEDKLPEAEIKRIASEVVQRNNEVYTLSGGYHDFTEEDLINGINPVEYAKNVIGAETTEKQEVVALAEQEVALAKQRLQIATKAYNYATNSSLTDNGEKLRSLQSQLNSTLGAFSLAERRRDETQKALEDADGKIKKGKTVKNYDEIKKAAEDASQKYITMQQERFDLYRQIDEQSGANIDDSVDVMAFQFKETHRRIEQLQSENQKTQKDIDDEIGIITKGVSEYRDYLFDKYNIPEEFKPKDIKKILKSQEQEEERKRVAARKASQLGAYNIQADIDRYSFGHGALAEGKMIQAKKARQERQTKSRQRNIWDNYFFADMTNDQADVAKKIQRIVTKGKKRRSSEQDIAQLTLLQEQARKLGLEIEESGYVKPLITAEEFKNNRSAHTIPEFSQEELIRRGLANAKNAYKEFVSDIKEANQELGQSIEPPKPDEGADEYYSKMADSYVDMSDEILETQQQTNSQMTKEQQKYAETSEQLLDRFENVKQTAKEATEAVKETVQATKLLTYNGKEFPILEKDKRKEIIGRISSSEDLQALRNISDKSRRRDRNAINRTKEALNAYSLTGSKEILEDLYQSYSGFGNKNVSLSTKIKPGVKSFIEKELGSKPTVNVAEVEKATQAQQQLENQTKSTTNTIAEQNEQLKQQAPQQTQNVTQQQKQLEQTVRSTTQAIDEQNQALSSAQNVAIETSSKPAQITQSSKKAKAETTADTTTTLALPNNQGASTTEPEMFRQIAGNVDAASKAISNKNILLNQELGIVTKELEVFSQLAAKMQEISSLAKEIKFEFNLNGVENFDDNFINKFNQLAQEIQNVDVTKFDSISAMFNGLNINKNIGENFRTLGENIKAFTEQVSQGTSESNFGNLIDLIDRISASGEYISKMSEMLKNSSKAGQGAFGFKYSQDPKAEQQMEEYLKLMDYLSNPKNITKNAYLQRQEDLYADNKGPGIATKDVAWYSDYQEKLKQAQQLYTMLSEIGVLESNARDLLEKRNRSYQNTEGQVLNSMKNEYEQIAFQAKYRVEQLEGMSDAESYAKGLQNLKDALNQVTLDARQGKITVEEYREAVNKAFSDFSKYKKINNVAFGNLASNKVLETPDGYTVENARQFAEQYVKSNYKKNISGISETTKVVDGNEVSVFTARVQDANGMVQNLRMSWSEVTGEIRVASSEVSKSETGIDSMLKAVTGKLKGLYAYWGAQLFNPYRLIGYAKQLVGIVKTYDSAFMEMRKVSQETTDSLKAFYDTSFNIGNQLGTNAATLQQSAASWMRLGKSMKEATEASKASAWLVNVSEFTNIDDATTALISMRQAFKDLSYEDFIDKLNGVGDNFSSSTQQLASGMQNVSSVLKVTGNDIDQSLALLTAANDITQDMSKASMGVRTVALRISGTQEAKQELEDLGEDVSDFVVQTQSKVDAQVRKYTATASNPKGISVLDSKGRLRSTFDILTDISQVYDEIVKKDNQFGTNTSNALLELLAGKTRSNILASILQNPDLLQEAYQQSQNSQGIGQKQLDVYLDSVEAKLAKLQNRMQELATLSIDSGWLKVFIDGLTNIIGLVNKLAKTFGGLKLILSTVGAFFTTKKGVDLFSTISGKATGFAGMIKNGFTNREMQKDIELMGGRWQDGKWGIDENAGLMDMVDSVGVDNLSKSMQNYIGTLSDTEKAQLTLGDVMRSGADIIGSFKNGIIGAGKNLLKYFGNMVIIFAAIKGIELLAEGIYNLATREKRWIEQGEEAKKRIGEISDGFNKAKESVDGFDGKEYFELLDKFEKGTIDTEEYEKFASINNELADLLPTLVTGYDDQGNALLDLGTNADEATSKLQTLLEQEKQFAAFEVSEELQTAVKGVTTRISQLTRDRKNQEKTIANLTPAQEVLGDLTTKAMDVSPFMQEVSQNDLELKQVLDGVASAYERAAYAAGIYLSTNEISEEGISETTNMPVFKYNIQPQLDNVTPEQIQTFTETFMSEIKQTNGLKDSVSEVLLDAIKLKDQDEREVKAEWNSLVPSLISQLSLYDSYNELNDQVQQGIRNAITNLDFTKLAEEQKDDFISDPRSFIRAMFLDPITNAISDESGEIDAEKNKLFNSLLSFDSSKMTNDGYKEYVNRILDQLTDNEEYKKQIKVILGFQYVDEDGNANWNVTKQRDDLFKMLGGEIEQDENGEKHYKKGKGAIGWSAFSFLTQGELDSLSYATKNMGVDLSTVSSWESLSAVIQKASEEMKKVNPIESDTFSSLFKDESDTGLQKITDTFQETIENVKKYREEISAGDFKDATDMTQTFNENMKAGENYTDYLNRVQLKALQDFADKYKEIISGITDPKEKEDAQRFLVDLLSGIDWDGFDVQNIKQRVFGQLYEIFGSDIGPEFRNMLEKSLVGDGDWEMFSTLLSSGMSPQEALDEVIGPDGLSARVQLQLDKQSLQDEIDRLTSERSTNEARKSMLEAQGFSIDKDYYIEDDEISNQLIRHYEEQIKIAEEEIANSDDKDFINTQQEKINELQRNIFSERATKASNRAAIRELALKPFEDARKEIESQMGTLESTKALGEANGQTDFSLLNQRMLDLLNSDNEQIDAEIEQLRHQQSELSIRAKWTNKELSDMDGYQELVDKEKDLLDQRAKNNQQRIELQKEIDNAPLVNLQNIGTALSRDTADAEKAISQAEEYGGEVGRAMYQSAIDAANAESKNLEAQRAEVAGKIAEMERLYTNQDGIDWNALYNNSDYQDLVSQLDNIDSSAEDIRQKIFGWVEAMNSLPANRIARQIESISASLEVENARIEAKRARGENITADDYNTTILLRRDALTTAQNNLAQWQEDNMADYNEAAIGGALWSTLNTEYQNKRAEVFNAEAELYSAMEEQNNVASDRLDAYINNQNAVISNVKAKIALGEARGENASGTDYQTMFTAQQNIIASYEGDDGKLDEAYRKYVSKPKGSDAAEAAWADYLNVQADYYAAQQAYIDLQVEHAESKAKDQENAIRDAKLEQTNLQNVISEQVAQSGEADASLYNALANSYTAEAEQQRALAKYWSDLAKSERNPELAAQFLEKSNTAFSDALSAEESAREQRTMPIQNELKELQNQMQDIQAEATRMEEAITKAETNHQKVGANMYKNLIKNGKDQIKNLVMQRVEQRKMLKMVDEGSEKWYEYQSNIDSLSSEISAMQNNIVGWSETMTSLVSTNAEALSSALSSAFSEMDSGTGMTIDTMNELKKQFSDLKGFNMDNVFYETADGVKMNKSAVEELVDQEYMLQQAILEEALAQENLSAADRVRYEQQLSMLQAIYDQQKANFTGYSEWQTAQSTDNAGKRYEDIQGALKSVQEMYSKGLTGTDDFRSFVSMIDQWGLDTVDAYDRNIEMVKRYVTEDSSGLTNFYSDMVSKGFGTGSASEGFSLNVPNVEEAARAMGMSAELMNILLSRAEDYGATNNWVESELDGNLKIQDATQKLIEAKTRLAELEQSGADTTAIEDAANVVQFYEQQVQDYVSNTGSVIAREGQITSAQLRSYQAQMQAIVDEMNDTELTQGMTDQQKQAWQNGHLESLKNLAVEAGVEVDWENIDLQESFKQAYPGYLEAPVTPKLTDVDLSATSDNEEVQSVINGLGDTTKWTDANTELQGYIDSINEFPYEELKTIDMNDGKWDKGYESAEKSLEGIAKMFGLSRKQADQLVEALHEMGAIGQETETYDKNSIVTNMSNLADKGYTSDQVMSMTEEERKKVYVDTVVDDTSYEEWKKDVESTTVQAKVQTALDSGKSAQDMLNMSDTALAQTIGIELDTENFDEQIAAARESLQEAATLTVKIDETQFSQLTGAEDVKIGADTSEVTTAIEEAETSVESSNPKMKVGATVGEALSSASHVRDTISSMNPQMTVGIKTDTSGLVSSISNALSNKIFTIKTTQVNVGKKYTGTMLSPAKASGTAYNAPLRMIPAQKAFAQGDVGLKEDEEALVNELGTESLIRDGQWFLIPGGMHVESLKKDDIVLNHLQTADLLKHGKAFGHGKAYAEGSGVPLSSIPLAPAHADRGKTRQNATSSTWNVKQPYTNKTPKDNTTAIKDNTKQLKKNNDTQKKGTSAIDAFKKWLDGWVDWIDNRIDDLNTRIDRLTNQAENLVGYSKKNKNIQSAMNLIADLKTFQNAKLVTGTTKGPDGVTAQYAKKATGGTKGTLLYDTMRGAARYQDQATKVMNKAVSSGILSKKKAAEITKLIQTGKIDITQYNENIRQVISSYEDWYGKSQDLINNIEELKQQYKDLEQTKLDNIVEQFETLADYASQVAGVSSSFVELATSRGTVVNDKGIKDAYKNQMTQQRNITSYLKQEIKAYQAELKNAAKVFGTASNEYREALTKYESMNQALNESITAYNDLNLQMKKLDIHKIELVIERLEKFGNVLAEQTSLAEKRENEYRVNGIVSEKDYADQITNNEKIFEQYWNSYQKRLALIADKIADTGEFDVNSEKYQELYNEIMGDVDAMYKLLESNEDLKEAIVELRWKAFEELERRLDNSISDYEHLQSLMKETQFFDADYGIHLTDRGYADIALISKMIDTERQQIADYREALQKLESDYKSGNITLTKYNDTSREYIEIIQQSASAVAGYKDSLVDLYKTQITNENNLLQENINRRKEALQAKKSYYDYDKTLSGKNKDIAQLTSQINALSNVSNTQGRAELARLQAQLKEAQDDLQETRREHEYDLMQQGFDKLSEDANKILEETIKHIDAIPEKFDETVDYMLDKMNGKYTEAYGTLQELLTDTGTIVDDLAAQELNLDVNKTNGLPEANLEPAEIITKSILADTIQINGKDVSLEQIEEQLGKNQDDVIKQVVEEQKAAQASAKPATTTNTNPAPKASGPVQKIGPSQLNAQGQINMDKDMLTKAIKDYQNAITAQDKLQASGASKAKIDAATEKVKQAKQKYQDALQKMKDDQAAYKKNYKTSYGSISTFKYPITQAIQTGAKRSNKVTTAEKKAHHKLWTAIVEKFGYAPNNSVYTKIANLLGVKVSKTVTNSEKNKILEALKKAGYSQFKGYKKGAKSIKDDELNWLHDSEVVIRKSDGAILQPFNAGDMVFTSKQSENLWKMSQVDTDVIKKMVSEVDMNKFIMPGISDKFTGRTETNNNNQSIHFDSLITINGNADQQTVADLQQIAQGLVNNREFKSNVIKFVTKDMTREAAKAGYRGR